MGRSKRLRAVAVALAVVGFMVSPWAITQSGARPEQTHDGDHGGDDHDHGGPSTSMPPVSTTQPNIGQRPAAERTSVIRYGPVTMPAPPPTSDGKHGHGMTGNQFMFNIQKPCNDCYITGMQADLVNPAGQVVGIRDNVMLHHMVLMNNGDGRSDATCQWGLPFPLGGLFGQRFFASGDERTPVIAQPGYGYYVGNGQFNMIYDLMTMSTKAETVSFQMKWMWIPASQAGQMQKLEPVWFDVDQCGDSEVSVPAGQSTKSWTWTVNRPGKIIGIGGHIHSGGVNVDIRNDTTGQTICNSVAGYGESAMYIDHHGEPWLSSMSVCGVTKQPNFAVPITAGQRVTITGHYNMEEAVPDQMAIAIAYVAQGPCGFFDWLVGNCAPLS
jgi:hypothetical protein